MNQTTETRHMGKGRKVQVVTKRGAFGLDTAAPASRAALHALILKWLRANFPDAVITGSPFFHDELIALNEDFPALTVLMPDRIAVFLDVRPQALRLTGHEQTLHVKMRKLGYWVATVRSLEEAQKALLCFGFVADDDK